MNDLLGDDIKNILRLRRVQKKTAHDVDSLRLDI